MHKQRKKILITIMLLSYLPILVGVNYRVIDSTDALSLIGRMFGMLGVILLTWQVLLGNHNIVGKFIPDIFSLNSIHKFLGRFGFLAIAVHPILIVISYSNLGINLLVPGIRTEFDLYKTFGVAAFTLLLIVWVASAILRGRLPFRWWKRIHLIAYVVLSLVFVHSFNLANSLSSGILQYYWYLVAVVALSATLYRLLQVAGLFRSYYKVVEVAPETASVARIVLSPMGKPLKPSPGQFIYIQTARFGEQHPFTVSHYDEATTNIAISPKASGPFSQKLHSLKPGQVVYIDGPFGVFTDEVYTTSRPVALIAGGIGITPFLRVLEKVKAGWDKPVTLIYGNRNQSDIPYISLMNELVATRPNFRAIHVLSEDQEYTGPKGYIAMPVLEKYLGADLLNHDFFVCGPPVMMDKIIPELRKAGVPAEQVYAERFSL